MMKASANDASWVNIPKQLYHYCIDNENDVGYGCVYRVLQTMESQWLGQPASSFAKIRTVLGMGNHNPLLPKKSWLEPIDIRTFIHKESVPLQTRLMLYFPNVQDVVSRKTRARMLRTKLTDADVLYINKESFLKDLKAIFRKKKYAIAIDNGVMSYAIVGFKPDRLLLVDPHTLETGRVVREMPLTVFFNDFWMVLQVY